MAIGKWVQQGDKSIPPYNILRQWFFISDLLMQPALSDAY